MNYISSVSLIHEWSAAPISAACAVGHAAVLNFTT